MSRQPATSARAQLRRIAFCSGLFALVLEASCGSQTFNLLGAGAGAGGVAGTNFGTGGARLSFAGADRGGAGSKAGVSDAGSGNTGNNGGITGGGFAGFSVTAGAAGEPQGGEQPCLPGESCIDGGVACPAGVNVCTRCKNDDDCGYDGLPYCDVTDGRCVECLPDRDNCKLGQNCDPTSSRCAKACLSSADCVSDSSHRMCAPSRQVCVECLSKSDCALVPGHESYECSGGLCVECLDATDCADPSKSTCLEFQCVAKP